ncbi:MAG: general secretion pathway protein GspD [Bdellovibrio sp.]|nr:general secretion pathway protein GspD [Bdellovibrio sp.]
MKYILAISICLASIFSFAEEKMKMNYNGEEINKIIQDYAKVSGQKFIIDSTVRGRITIINPTEVSLEEAFSQLSDALALNGFAIVKQNDVMVIRNARSAQRDGIQVYTELPPAKPQRMVTWVVTLKNTTPSQIMNELRLLTSSYGEMSTNSRTNQIVFSDWSVNLQRVAEVIKQVDQQVDPKLIKLVEQGKKESAEARKEWKKRAQTETKHAPPPPKEKETN